MKSRKLGQTDITVSILALGCWPFAGIETWGCQDESDSIATVRAALDAGINFFDTAEGYGNGASEVVLGKGLAGRREEAVIATKVSASHLSADEVVKACERSLKNLDTEVIDLYQIHWPSRTVPLEETMAALERLKTQGKVRAIGVSNFGPGDLTDLLSVGRCETNQLPYSLLWRAVEHEIQPLCVENGIGIICYSPLAQGLLTGRYASADGVPDGLSRIRLYSRTRPMAQHGQEGCEAEAFEALARIREIATGLGQPMAAVALAWVRQQAGVTSLLVGARTPEELRMNLSAVDVVLSEQVLQELEAATEAVKQKIGRDPDMWNSPSRYN